MIRLSIVEPNDIVRNGLEVIIETSGDMEVVCFSRSLSSLTSLNERFNPSVSLIDLDTEPELTMGYIKELKSVYPNSKVIVITNDKTDYHLTDLLKLGVDGYINKNDSIDEILNGIRYVNDSTTYIRLDSVDKFLNAYMGLNSTDIKLKREASSLERKEKGLSNKEYEVLQLACDGKTNVGISRVLGISSCTVKNHIYSIMKKLETKDRTQSVVMGIKNGWVEIK